MEKTLKCDLCHWFSQNEDKPYGVCHRTAPQIFEHIGTCWPGVSVDDWCGEWKERQHD